MTATLELERTWVGVGVRPFEIRVDGNVVGKIPWRRTVDLEVDPGSHSLSLGLGHAVSPEHSFEARDGEVARFVCHGATLWPVWVASFFKPDLAIVLKQLS